MARARLAHNVFAEESATDVDLRKAANVVVTVFETDGTTLFAATIYNAASGGSSLVNGTDTKTNASGLLDLYTAPENARRVKLTVVGVTAQVDTAFAIDEGTAVDTASTQTITGNKTLSGTTTLSGTVTASGAMTATHLTVAGVVRDSERHHWDPRESPYTFTEATRAGGAGITNLTWYTGASCDQAIEWAIAQATASSTCKRVYIPPGVWGIESVDAKNIIGVEIFGDGPTNSCLTPLPGAVDQHAFDISGSHHAVLRDFSLGQVAFAPIDDFRPTTILYYGVGSSAGDALTMVNMILYGLTDGGTFFVEGSVSSKAIGCYFHSYGIGGNAAAVRMKDATDWSFVHCERHQHEAWWLGINKVVTVPPTDGAFISAGSSSARCLILQATSDVNFVGSNYGGGGDNQIAVDLLGLNYRPGFFGNEPYAQEPASVVYNTHFRVSGTGAEVVGLTVTGGNSGASSVVFSLADGAILRDVEYHTRLQQGNATALITCDGTGQIYDSNFNGAKEGIARAMSNLSVSVGAGGTIKHSTFSNISTLTAGTLDGVEWTDTAGAFHFSDDIHLKRIVAKGTATDLAAGNFTSLTNWGTVAPTPTVAGTEVAGTFSIVGAAGVAANPSLVFTYPGGAYTTNTPQIICQLTGSNGAPGAIPITQSSKTTSSVTLTFGFTPVNGTSYSFTLMMVG